MKPTPLKDYIRPASLDEALKYLSEGEGRCIPIAGGLSVRLSEGRKVDSVVDLSCLPLSYVREESDGALLIGATTPARDIELSPLAREYADGLPAAAAEAIAVLPLRNMITAGGDIVQAYYWSCLPPLLLALEGGVRVVSPRGERWVVASEFFAKHPKTQIKYDELVVEIKLPASVRGWAGKYVNFKRVDSEYAIVNLAIAMDKDGDTIKAVRIATGAVSTLPVRMSAVEETLTGGPLTAEHIEAAVTAGLGALKPLNDFRFSKEYRRNMTGVLLRRALMEMV